MIVIGKRELQHNLKKYLALAETNKVYISHHGKTILVIQNVNEEISDILSNYRSSLSFSSINDAIQELLVN